MNRVEEALTRLKEGFGCSQALFATYAPQFGMDRETALKLSGAFAGGFGRTGETCGAVTSALMIIGLKYGRVKADDKETQAKTDSKVKEFLNKFQTRHGSILCRDLLDTNIATPEGMDEARRKQLFATLCPRYVRDAAEVLEEILREE
jgi:C_GCAxxG_C_C family probable redox protein